MDFFSIYWNKRWGKTAYVYPQKPAVVLLWLLSLFSRSNLRNEWEKRCHGHTHIPYPQIQQKQQVENYLPNATIVRFECVLSHAYRIDRVPEHSKLKAQLIHSFSDQMALEICLWRSTVWAVQNHTDPILSFSFVHPGIPLWIRAHYFVPQSSFPIMKFYGQPHKSPLKLNPFKV